MRSRCRWPRARCRRSVRSTVLGMVSAAGSLGALLSAPIGQMLNEGFGWRVGLAGFVILSIVHDPGRVVRRPGRQDPLPKPAGDDIGNATAATAAKTAFGNASFVVMTCAYMVCGMQLVLPHHASAVVSGDLRPRSDAERADARHDRRLQRAGLAVLRLGRPALEQAGAARRDLHPAFAGARLVLHAAGDAGDSTLLFGAIMGFLWMGVGPLVAGAVAEMFGLQLAGDDPGPRLHEPPGRQLPRRLWRRGDLRLSSAPTPWPGASAWRSSLAGGIIQVAFALIRPSQPPQMLKTA